MITLDKFNSTESKQLLSVEEESLVEYAQKFSCVAHDHAYYVGASSVSEGDERLILHSYILNTVTGKQVRSMTPPIDVSYYYAPLSNPILYSNYLGGAIFLFRDSLESIFITVFKPTGEFQQYRVVLPETPVASAHHNSTFINHDKLVIVFEGETENQYGMTVALTQTCVIDLADNMSVYMLEQISGNMLEYNVPLFVKKDGGELVLIYSQVFRPASPS